MSADGAGRSCCTVSCGAIVQVSSVAPPSAGLPLYSSLPTPAASSVPPAAQAHHAAVCEAPRLLHSHGGPVGPQGTQPQGPAAAAAACVVEGLQR